MDTKNSKIGFSKRFKQALECAGFSDLSLASIATKFNLRHPNKSVTPQSVHNWLIGASIPTDDKIETLAKLLNTSPEWLRYGITQAENEDLTFDEQELLQYFRNISASKKKVIMAILREFQS